MKLTDNEIIFCQALAMTTLLAELNNKDFLRSDYYKNLKFEGNEENYREILESFGLGNPATMQMYLYLLLVMPKELLDPTYIETSKKQINKLFIQLIDNVDTTYKREDRDDIATIDFYNHIRNSIAHSNCRYRIINDKRYVEFCDMIPPGDTQHCEILIETGNVGIIITKLAVLLMDYLNERMKL